MHGVAQPLAADSRCGPHKVVCLGSLPPCCSKQQLVLVYAYIFRMEKKQPSCLVP
jgi:hypothetical protein